MNVIHSCITDTLRAAGCDFALTDVSLCVNERELRRRLEARSRAEAVRRGVPFSQPELNALVERALDRAKCFAELNTVKLDVSALTIAEAAARIQALAGISDGIKR